jgi:GNAT superfamily N-acetyltransferase
VSAPLRIRDAERADVELLFSRIVELAEYERAPEAVLGTPELLAEALFGPAPLAEAVLAELGGDPVGHALFFTTFSTWHCLPGLWLEELYVSPAHRRGGVGAALLAGAALEQAARGPSGAS